MTNSNSTSKRSRLRTVLVVLVTAAIAGPVGAFISGKVAPSPSTTVAVAEAYHCPMHPGVVQDHPGECPICGMKLVKAVGPPTKSTERKLLFYRSPMEPSQTSPVPAKDSMGMAYLPVYKDESSNRSEIDGLAAVALDATRQQLIGLRTSAVDRGVVGGAIRTVGRVSTDETRVRRVSVKVPGYVERIFVDFIGKPVRKGDPLFSLYSPDVLAAENEFLTALKTQPGPLLGAARRKLELWDVPESELQRIEREGTASKTVTYVSPVAGVVTKKEIVEGARIEVGSMPYEIVDLSTVWVVAEIYEAELRFVAPGLSATLTLNAYPERHYSGKVLFVDPMLDPKTRTARVRLAFQNSTGELRPEMFGEVTLERPPRLVLRVPSDALVRSGAEDVVFVSQPEGRFEPRRVKTGEVGREFAEVLEGLTEGESVVTRATFLIDSESRLRASLARISSGAASELPSLDASTPSPVDGAKR